MAQSMMTRSSAACRATSSSTARRAVAARPAANKRVAAVVVAAAAPQQRAAPVAAPQQQQQQQRATAARAVAEAAQQQQAAGTETWVALVASAEFFCNDAQNESLAEQLRERARYYKEQGRDADFFLVPNPAWLDAKYPSQAKQVRRPAMALVSTDAVWQTFMKLRLDRVLKIELTGMGRDEALAAGADLPEFAPPAKWTAPYPMYTPGWWRAFYPPGAAK